MNKAVWLSCWLSLAGAAGGASAQGVYTESEYYGDDYDAFFGEQRGNSEGGARTLDEARREGGSYRIGERGPGAVAPAAPSQGVYIVSEGDTLWEISDRYMGDPWQWPKLWSYNPEVTNPHWIYPEDRLRLKPTADLSEPAAVAKAAERPTLQRAGSGGQGPSGTIFLRDQAYLDRDTLKETGQIIGGPEESMFLAPTDQVYVRFQGDPDVQAGDSFAIFRAIHDWERYPEEKGRLVRVHGTVQVRSYDRSTKVARGEVTEALDPIERGFFVAKVDRVFDIVPPKRNTANVVARIIASARPRKLLASGNVVFLDVGRGHGIEPGNRFFIVRRGDPWQEGIFADPVDLGNISAVPPYSKKDLPKEVIAELRVLKVRKDTTIALVIRSDADIALGEVAEMREGY